MSTEVLYRKWRPRAFGELAGQEAVARTLTNAIASGKVAHAYLFSGPRGTGKTTTGRLLAKAVNCQKPKAGEPCNACESCTGYLEGRALDLIELDAASNRGIDEIRNLREKANFAASGGEGARKLYLVDEVHMLTEPAFNALLKTLEEPPPHVIFVLATTEVHKVPATVISRCQRFDFRRIPLSAVVERLSQIAAEEKISCPKEALELIARTATGSMRDAINLLEQLVDSYGKKPAIDQVKEGLGLVIDARSAELAAHAVQAELSEGLALISSVRDDGLDLRQFQRQVIAQLRGLLLAKAGVPASDSWSDEQLAAMRETVAAVTPDQIVATLRAFGEADLRADPLSPLPLELALASASLAQRAPPVGQAPQPRAPAPAPPPRPTTAKATPSPAAPRAATPSPLPEERVPPAKTERPAPKAAAANGDQPLAASASSAGANGDSPELGEVRARWPDIFQRARELNHKTGALLNSGCGIVGVSESEVVFGFRHKIHLDRMQGDGGENMRALQQAVDDVLGAGRMLRCVLEPAVDVQKAGRGGHLLQAAQEMGAEVLPDEA